MDTPTLYREWVSRKAILAGLEPRNAELGREGRAPQCLPLDDHGGIWAWAGQRWVSERQESKA